MVCVCVVWCGVVGGRRDGAWRRQGAGAAARRPAGQATSDPAALGPRLRPPGGGCCSLSHWWSSVQPSSMEPMLSRPSRASGPSCERSTRLSPLARRKRCSSTPGKDTAESGQARPPQQQLHMQALPPTISLPGTRIGSSMRPVPPPPPPHTSVTSGPNTRPTPRASFSCSPGSMTGSDQSTSVARRLAPRPLGSMPPLAARRRSSSVPSGTSSPPRCGAARLRLLRALPLLRGGGERNSPPCSTSVELATSAASGSCANSRLHTP